MSKLHRATHTIPTHRPWWSNAWREIQVRYLLWCARCIVEEREGYERAGLALGEAYMRNSHAQEHDLRARAAILQIRS